jgi:hypothetical protein
MIQSVGHHRRVKDGNVGLCFGLLELWNLSSCYKRYTSKYYFMHLLWADFFYKLIELSNNPKGWYFLPYGIKKC